jgi:hypothetical protein
VFGRAVQTDDDIAKKHATNATTIIFETQTINAIEIFLPSGVRTFSRLSKTRRREGDGTAYTPDDEVYERLADGNLVKEHLRRGTA